MQETVDVFRIKPGKFQVKNAHVAFILEWKQGSRKDLAKLDATLKRHFNNSQRDIFFHFDNETKQLIVDAVFRSSVSNNELRVLSDSVREALRILSHAKSVFITGKQPPKEILDKVA